MIITSDEAITLLQVKMAKKPLLDELIPRTQDWLLNYLNNPFHTSNYTISSGIAFVHNDGSADVITDSENTFDDDEVEFSDNMDIHVQGSDRNDGFYSVATATAGTLTLVDDEHNTLVNESADNAILITRVKFPKGIEIPFARLLNYFMQKESNPNVKSKSLGGRSVTYASDGGIPKDLLMQFNPWRKLN